MKLLLVVIFVALLGVLTLALNVPAEYGSCQEAVYEGLGCTIDSVIVEGCRKDKNSKACKVKRNVNAAITISFTPDFEGDDITMMAYAVVPLTEKAFPDMDANACNHMTCPVVYGVQQNYTFGMKLAPSYPLGLFNVRFLMKKGGENKCCFMTRFRIEK